MHKLEMIGQRKRIATEPPFIGQILEMDGTPANLLGPLYVTLDFRVGTPGQTPIIDGRANFTDYLTGQWEYKLTDAEAAALPVGVVLVHVVLQYVSGLVEPVPFDHYFQLEVLEML